MCGFSLPVRKRSLPRCIAVRICSAVIWSRCALVSAAAWARLPWLYPIAAMVATATDVAELLATHPKPSEVDRGALARCIAECFDCALSCTACADADLAEEDVSELRRCIRLCLDCADVCDATGRVVSRQTEYEPETSRAQVESCRRSCSACAEECERHSQHHEHCRICAETCRRCEEACANLLDAIG